VVVKALRYAYGDVARPFEGELCGCHNLGADGHLDLTLEFDTKALVEQLELADLVGQDVALTLTGSLFGESPDLPGTPIRGEDCVRVMAPAMNGRAQAK